MKRLLWCFAYLAFSLTMYAQYARTSRSAVPPEARYERIMAVVPMVGKGTWEDPKRPQFAPVAKDLGRDKSGILAYYHEVSDDGKSAIVVFVAANRSAFSGILSSRTPGIQIFDRAKPGLGNSKQAEAAVTAQLKTVRKDFDMKRFAVRVQ